MKELLTVTSQKFKDEWDLPQPDLLPVSNNPVHRCRNYLLSLQDKSGYWEAFFEMDVRQTCEYIMLKHFFGRPERGEEKKMLNHIFRMERPGGGWGTYRGGPPDLSTTVTVYYALLLAGISKEHPVMQRARDVIMSQGGIMNANCFTRNYLQLFGQMKPESLPAMPVEIMLFPKWFIFNIYTISSWSRGIMIPLLVISAMRKFREPLSGPSCDELFPENCDRSALPIKPTKKLLTWHNFFLLVDRLIKIYEKRPINWLRKMALSRAHTWITSHMGREGGLASIFPSMVNSCIALNYLGYDPDHPIIANELRALEALKVDDGDARWIQPCFSTLWDTAWCLKILPELGVDTGHPGLVQAKEYLLAKQVGISGDWQEKIPPVPCGGWYFQRENSLYPDTDDTAAVLLGLRHYRDDPKVRAAVDRAIRWLFAMQCRDGGWAAFDYQGYVCDCFNYIPFADHGALLDPPTADVTARVMESLAQWGYDHSHPDIQRGIEWLLRDQKPEGCWYGRWGVNYIYGTWAVLSGIKECGFDMRREPVRKAVRWLLDCQRPDGGWGESCATYASPSQKGRGEESTASQTAWALLGLDAAGDYDTPAVRRGIDYLVQAQRPDGSWDEEMSTGTGFPGVCYLRYHLYRNHFPALALARILPKFSYYHSSQECVFRVS